MRSFVFLPYVPGSQRILGISPGQNDAFLAFWDFPGILFCLKPLFLSRQNKKVFRESAKLIPSIRPLILHKCVYSAFHNVIFIFSMWFLLRRKSRNEKDLEQTPSKIKKKSLKNLKKERDKELDLRIKEEKKLQESLMK